MDSTLELYAGGEQGVLSEVPSSGEKISATGSSHPFYTPSILDESVERLPPAWESVSLEPGGNNTQALRPGTKDPTISTALSLDSVMQDKNGMAQSDTAPAANDAISLIWEDIVQIVSMLEEEAEGERAVAGGEETPETGRGNERPLSEDDNMSLSSGDPAGGQNASPAPRVNNTASSDRQVRPGFGAPLQAQPSQVYPPMQASLGNFQPMPQQPMPQPPMPQPPMPHQPLPQRPMSQQPMPHQPLPHQPMPQQSMPHQPMPQQPMPQRSWRHQYVPYSTPGNTSLQFSQDAAAGLAPPRLPLGPPQPPPMQPAWHEGYVNQVANYGYAYVNPASFASTAYGSGPPQAPAYPQWPSQNSSGGGSQARTPPNMQAPMRLGNAADRFATLHMNQVPANSWPPPRMSLPPNTNAPTQPQVRNRQAAGSGLEELRQNNRSLQGPPSAASRRVEGPEPVYFAADVPRVTTPEAEQRRNSIPSMRDLPILNVKTTLLASMITDKQNRGHPYTGLPGVTAEDIQEFRSQYRSRELRLPDDKVKAILQAMKLLGLSLTELRPPTGPAQSASGTQSANDTESGQLPGTTQPDDDDHVPEYLLDQFMEILELSGEQEALRFLRESKAKAARESQGSDRSRRKRRNAMTGMSAKSSGKRKQPFTLDEIFYPGDDDPYGGALDVGHMSSMDTVVDDDLSAFGITEIQDARGQIIVTGSSRRRKNANSSPALNRTIEIHIDDDLVGAAESSTPVEKFRRLMNSSPTRRSPKKRAKA